MDTSDGWRLAALLGALVLLGVTASLAARLDSARPVALAAARAVVQLGVIALLLAWVLEHPAATAAYVVAMTLVAAWTSWNRVGRDHGPPMWPLLPVVAGAGPVVVLALLSGVLPATPVAVLPTAGILIGGAMTGTSLFGRAAVGALRDRRGELEAGLALGLLRRDAAMEVVRPLGIDALVPGLDQTRTVGLVTLPGAFVGVLLGGGSATQAGATQLVVLLGILAAQVVAVAISAEVLARSA